MAIIINPHEQVHGPDGQLVVEVWSGSDGSAWVRREDYLRLEDAVANHRAQTGHSMCHENDEELWRAIGGSHPLNHRPPNWFAFMWRCFLYRLGKRKGCSGCQSAKS